MRRSRYAAALVILLLLVLSAVGSGCRKKSSGDLIILSPHHEKIRTEFAQAFSAWHKAKYGSPVSVEWRDAGGSTTCAKLLINQYQAASSSGIDLYFGGGGPDHVLLAEKGILVPVEMPEETLAQLPETLTGVRMMDAGHRWYGAVVSCFGIIYNGTLLKDKGMAIPKTWDDLAVPQMFGWMELADATQSGTAKATFEMIVQSAPDWPSGWAKLIKIFGNCKKFSGSASDVTRDVANGEVLAGTAIDFYAYDQIITSGQSVGFTIVAGKTAFTPDPIAMLKGAPHPELAKQFMEFVLSDKGQALWCLPPGSPDGPITNALYREPIRKDVYEKYAGKMLPQLANPYAHKTDFQLDLAAYEVRTGRLLGPLMQSAVLDSREQLSQAWKVILDAGSPPDLVAEFVKLPDNLKDGPTSLQTAKLLSDEKQRLAITDGWQKFFRAKYEGIIAKKK